MLLAVLLSLGCQHRLPSTTAPALDCMSPDLYFEVMWTITMHDPPLDAPAMALRKMYADCIESNRLRGIEDPLED